MKYRSDISGLRALAVVPVVLHHANPRLLPGGFVGVDVFFVISGYLITSIMAADLARDRFRFSTFYDRRIRRIVPAFALVTVTTALAALVILPPGLLADFGQSLQYASIFLANRYFLAGTNYFAAGAHEFFLLHTWSLAVEEQFYLFWPLGLVLLSHPRVVRFRGYVVWAVLLVSFYMATKNLIQAPPRAFYNFNSRAWELLLGAVLALGLVPRLKPGRMVEALAFLGLALIVTAIATFSDHTPFPGPAALLPTVGAVLLLWTGAEGRTTAAGRLLSFTPLVGIGLISYSLYLWHWPILTLYKFVHGVNLSLAAGAGLIAASIVVSILSWRYVETPLRRAGGTSRPEERRGILVGLGGLGALALLGWGLWASNGLPGRASPGFREAEAAVGSVWQDRICLQQAGRGDLIAAGCRFGDRAAGAPVVALWGDSFANHHAPALDALGREQGFALEQMTKPGCYPKKPEEASGLPRTREEIACDAFREAALARILDDPRIVAAVIAGRWPPGAESEAAIAQLREAVARITAAGKPVLLIGPPPQFGSGGGRCVLRKRFLGQDEAECGASLAGAAAGSVPVEELLKRIPGDMTGVGLFLLSPYFCDAERCRPTYDGRIVYTDSAHLNVPGSLHLVDPLRAPVRALLPAKAGSPGAPAPAPGSGG